MDEKIINAQLFLMLFLNTGIKNPYFWGGENPSYNFYNLRISMGYYH